MRTSVKSLAPFGAMAVLGALSACEGRSGEMQWARGALERNAQLEIVASDEAAGTFTVRDRASGQLQVVRFDEVTAALPGPRPAARQQSVSAAPAPEGAQDAISEPGRIDVPGNASAQASSDASGSGVPAASDAAPPTGQDAASFERPKNAATAANNSSGRVIAQGPGYTIAASGGTPASDSQAPAASTANPAAATEQRGEPLVCQGQRFMHIDGRNISFTGDGVRAEDGCELFITNSQITANGVGVTARGARVHIANSTVSGESAALQASENARVYTRAARFRGMIRRLDDAVIQEGDAPASN